ncbi:MAG: hypothetical protein CSB21_00740 [Deltaproteobacteria bacterium]|nr:MAG: hypothetical protein CSB21_00740 [Deltaproteobacteria bacterium]
MKKSEIITKKNFIKFLYHLIRTYSKTFRLEIINEKQWIDAIKSGEKIILCLWHQQFFPLIRYFKNYAPFNPSLMISQSKDGEMIAGVANLTGWLTARGSSTKGGKTAMEEMIKNINQFGLAAHILDGPTGPAGIVKNGAVKMACTTGASIVPLYCETENDWHVSSWDKFIFPKPFSKVKIIYGEPIPHEKTDDLKKMEIYRKQIEEKMKPFLKYF